MAGRTREDLDGALSSEGCGTPHPGVFGWWSQSTSVREKGNDELDEARKP